MITSSVLRLAAGLVAASALITSAAQANGVRLNFGGPLGTFVASPAPGYGGGSGYGKSAYGAKKCPPKSTQTASRKPSQASKPRVTVARHVAKPEPRVTRHVERTPVRIAEYKAKTVSRSTRSIVQAPVETPVKIDTAATTPVIEQTSSGSQALAAGSLPAAEKLNVANLTPETVPAVAAPDAVKAETQDDAPAPAGSAPVEPAKTAVVASGPQDCKKFIPAVGVTITVGCEK